MAKVTDDNRDDLIESYINRTVDNMSTKDLTQFVYDVLCNSKSEYTNAELETEIMDCYPDLLGEDV